MMHLIQRVHNKYDKYLYFFLVYPIDPLSQDLDNKILYIFANLIMNIKNGFNMLCFLQNSYLQY